MACGFILLIVIYIAVSDRCPNKTGRDKAWYNGELCPRNDLSCCFEEKSNNDKFDNATRKCCYKYGIDGPLKCCDIKNVNVLTGFIIIITVCFGIMFVCIFLVVIFFYFINPYDKNITQKNTKQKSQSSLQANYDKTISLSTSNN